jgi:membrane protease YdiL (CAAX protease family)
MEQAVDTAGEQPARWRRIVNFPLVAMLIAVALYLLVIIVSGAIGIRLLPKLPGLTREQQFELIGAVALIALYKLVIRHLGDRPRDDLRLSGSAKELGIGLVAGFLLFSAVVAVAALVGVYRIHAPGDFSAFLAALISPAIFPAISEEMLFRGILFRWLEEFGGSWVALMITSALFGAAHLMNPNASYIAAVGIALEAGVMLGAAYMLTRSLWLPIGIHAAWNFAQGEIYDIPVSGLPVHGMVNASLKGPPLLTGNGFGLEASLIAIAVATIFGLWLLWLAIRKGEMMAPWWVTRRRAVAR